MKNFITGTFIFIISSIVLVGLMYGLGWIRVHKTSTIGKAQQNAERQVFEESQSYVESKRQSALKYYIEFKRTKNPHEKSIICEVVGIQFANFDIEKFKNPKIYNFIHNCMAL